MRKGLIILGVVLLALLQLAGFSFALANNNLQFTEIAWMGTATSSSDEWIELKNNHSETIDLNGWKIIARDGIPIIDLTGSIVPGGFYLLERTDDEAVPGILADLVYGGKNVLVDGGEFLELKNPGGEVIDAVDALSGWPAGDNTTKQTMDWDGTKWVMSVNAGGTPRAERMITSIDNVATSTNDQLIFPRPAGDLSALGGGSQGEGFANNDSPMAIKHLLGEIVINEFVSDPSDGEIEWVELFNNTDQSIDLSGWIMIEGSGKETVLSGNILAHKYFVVEKIKGNLNNDGDVIVLHDSDKNLIDKVTYGNWDDGQVGDNAPVAKDPKSVARKIDGYNSFNNAFDFVRTNQPTKSAVNVIFNEELQIKIKEATKDTATTTASSSQLKIDNLDLATTTATTTKKNLAIKINEIFPNPEKDDEEWIELYNDSMTKINLLDWTVDDDQGGSKPYRFATSTWIAPKGFYVLKRAESKLSLNNDGDKVVLSDDGGNIVDDVAYEKTIVGQAYARSDKGQWAWTMAVTPGEENSLIQKEMIKSEQEMKVAQNSDATVLDIPLILSLEDAHKIEKGAYVLVEGVVTVLPGVLGSQYFYINSSQKSETGLLNFGLQIYSYKKDFPALKIGDIIEVIGEISETNGEKRLKTDTKKDIHVIGRGKIVSPQKTTCENIDDNLLGALVEVDGEISDLKSTGIYIDDGSDEMRVYIKKTSGINYKDYKEAAKIRVIGIIGSAKGEVRLLPRSKDDIIILEKKEDADAEEGANFEPKVLGVTLDNSDLIIEPRDGGREAVKYSAILLAGGVSLFLIWYFRFKK